jgi:hypothetical protein
MSQIGSLLIPGVVLALLSAGGEVRAEDDEHDSLGRPMSAVSLQVAKDGREAAAALHLVARVQVQPGELFEVYEARPGVLILSGAGAPEGQSKLRVADLRGRPLPEVWRMVAGNQPMPAKLKEAVARIPKGKSAAHKKVTPVAGSGGGNDEDADGAGPPQMTAKPGPGTPKPPPPPPSGGFCNSKFLTSDVGKCPKAADNRFTLCLDDHWNGAWASLDGAEQVVTAVCPEKGDVTFKVNYENGGSGAWTVKENHDRFWIMEHYGCGMWPFTSGCGDVKVKVTDAKNDRFNFRFSGF